ncbi:MAG: hypothetical protein KF804_09145 [Burkholderiales bacterium]|nr:hypothetical protein [Burkholderiales bacterium]
MKQQKLKLAGAVVAAATLALGIPAQAQQWPVKPVRLVVPFGAGGGTDIQGRLLGQKFQQSMGQNFLVENRSGASGLIGAEFVARSAPDGYNILFTTASMAVNTVLYAKRLKFNPLTDLDPVSWVSSVPLVLVVHPSVPAKNLKEFVALAKRPQQQPDRRAQRRRHHQPPVGGNAQAVRRRPRDAGAVQGRRPRHGGPDQRRIGLPLRHRAGGPALHQVGQGARPRRDHRQALLDFPRPADDEFHVPGFRG